MGINKHTGNTLLDAAISKINKDFSKALVATRPTIQSIPPLPTGSLSLDLAIGIGGLPLNRVIEIFGPESSGKTSWALFWAKKAQDLDLERYVLIVDAEHSMTDDWIAGFGIDMDRILFMRPENASEALDPAMDLVKTGTISYMVFDSIDALQTEGELSKGVTESNVGGVSKVLSRFFREFSKVVQTCNCTAVFINQVRDNPGAGMYGNPEVTPGGKALKFYASLRLRTMNQKPSENTKNAFTSRFQIKKNKAAPAVARNIEVDFVYGRGPDPIMDTLHAAKDLGVLAFAGSSLKLKEGNDINIICSGGAAGFANKVHAEPQLLDRVRTACMETRKHVEEPLIEEEPEEEPPEE